MHTKHYLRAALVTAAVAASATALAGITGSKHDFRSTGGGAQQTSSKTTEICVYCHTPHGASTDITAPLWNKSKPSTTYSTYSQTNSSTIDGSVLSVGSISLACLSCHDGSQAMDVMINEPGSGAGSGTKTGGAISDGFDSAAIGAMTGFAAVGSGGDLTNDHPVGIQYGKWGSTTNDADFNIAATTDINSTAVYWVDSEDTANNTREKTDMILYNRDFGGTTAPAVECGSCHDPHNKDSDSTGEVQFLRISNADSKVCLTCHIK